jgi:uncharacterized membrane protein
MVQNEFCEEELPSNTTLISLIISALKSSTDELPTPLEVEPSLREFVFNDVASLLCKLFFSLESLLIVLSLIAWLISFQLCFYHTAYNLLEIVSWQIILRMRRHLNLQSHYPDT